MCGLKKCVCGVCVCVCVFVFVCVCGLKVCVCGGGGSCGLRMCVWVYLRDAEAADDADDPCDAAAIIPGSQQDDSSDMGGVDIIGVIWVGVDIIGVIWEG